MTTVNVYEAKTQLSKLLELVERGESVTIARAGKPVADPQNSLEHEHLDLMNHFIGCPAMLYAGENVRGHCVFPVSPRGNRNKGRERWSIFLSSM